MFCSSTVPSAGWACRFKQQNASMVFVIIYYFIELIVRLHFALDKHSAYAYSVAIRQQNNRLEAIRNRIVHSTTTTASNSQWLWTLSNTQLFSTSNTLFVRVIDTPHFINCVGWLRRIKPICQPLMVCHLHKPVFSLLLKYDYFYVVCCCFSHTESNRSAA